MVPRAVEAETTTDSWTPCELAPTVGLTEALAAVEKYLQVDSTEPGGTHSEQAATGTRLGAELSAVKGEGLVAGLDEGLDEGLDTGLGAGLAVVPAGRTMGPWRPVMPC